MSFKIFSYRESWSRRQHRQFNENKRKEALFVFVFFCFFLFLTSDQESTMAKWFTCSDCYHSETTNFVLGGSTKKLVTF